MSNKKLAGFRFELTGTVKRVLESTKFETDVSQNLFIHGQDFSIAYREAVNKLDLVNTIHDSKKSAQTGVRQYWYVVQEPDGFGKEFTICAEFQLKVYAVYNDASQAEVGLDGNW